MIFHFKGSQGEGGLLRNMCKFIVSTLLQISVINYFNVNYNQRPYTEFCFAFHSFNLTPRRVAVRKNKGWVVLKRASGWIVYDSYDVRLNKRMWISKQINGRGLVRGSDRTHYLQNHVHASSGSQSSLLSNRPWVNLFNDKVAGAWRSLITLI